MILPEAFLERMEKMLGEEYPDFLKAYEEDKYQALRLNALKYNMDGISAAQLKKQREDWLAELKAVPWAENGYYYPADMQPGRHPYHAAGVYYIQEPRAMAPARVTGV